MPSHNDTLMANREILREMSGEQRTLSPLERELLEALKRIAIVPCNCAPDALPGDECESCIARDVIAKTRD